VSAARRSRERSRRARLRLAERYVWWQEPAETLREPPDPEHLDGGPWIASPVDLLATKLETLHDRVEARDYIDIETLLRGRSGAGSWYRGSSCLVRHVTQSDRYGESHRLV
jgi:hypothetical protein